MPADGKTFPSANGRSIRCRVGFRLDKVELNPADARVRVQAGNVRLDLGGSAKAMPSIVPANCLRNGDFSCARAWGFSSVLALDAPPGRDGWPLTISLPAPARARAAACDGTAPLLERFGHSQKGSHRGPAHRHPGAQPGGRLDFRRRGRAWLRRSLAKTRQRAGGNLRDRRIAVGSRRGAFHRLHDHVSGRDRRSVPTYPVSSAHPDIDPTIPQDRTC